MSSFKPYKTTYRFPTAHLRVLHIENLTTLVKRNL